MIQGFTDFHVHPDYSIDATGDIGSYCRKALSIGLGAICFTTHYDSNPRRAELDGFWGRQGRKVRISDRLLAEYIEEVRKAGERFADSGIRVYCGLEMDYYPDVEMEAERIRTAFPFEFVIGSLHCLNDISISDPREATAYFHSRTVGQMADDYFRLLLMASSCSFFDCLGHLDYYVRFAGRYYGHDFGAIEIERFDPVFERMKLNDLGMEINTSPYKRGISEFHPSREIIERAVEAGVSISSVGSDSHKPEELGRGIREAISFLKKRNLRPVFPRSHAETTEKIL